MNVEVGERTENERGLFSRGMRLIWSYVRMHPKPFMASVAGAAVYAVASIGLTVVLGRITDRVIHPAFQTGVTASTDMVRRSGGDGRRVFALGAGSWFAATTAASRARG